MKTCLICVRPFGRVIALLATFAAPALFAQSTGVVTGTVTDPHGAFVQGAEVKIEGTALTGTTDRSGHYRIDAVPGGAQRLRASYLGLPDATASVTAVAGREIAADLAFNPGNTIVMERFVVESIAEGQARAVNRQRTSDTIQNIIASDAIGRLPDASVGEALARLPGISVQVDRGEPDKIAVRGLSPKYNNVALNGERLPAVFDSTEVYDNRSVSLNTVPTDMISGIEVTKAITPDMDADSLGGAVNLLTKSSLDFRRRVLSGKLEAGYNDLTKKEQYSANFTFGDHFAGNKVGLLLTGAFQFNNRGIEGINANYIAPTAVAGTSYDSILSELDFRFRHLDRVRKGSSGQLDFRTGEHARHWVRGFYNVFEDREQRRRLIIRLANGGTILPGTTNTIGNIDGGRVLRRDRSGKKQTDLASLAAGGVWEQEGYKLDYSTSFAWTAFKVRRTESQWEYRITDYIANNGIPDFTYDRSDPNFPRLNDPLGHITNYARQEIGNRGGYNVRDDDNTEEDLNAQANLTIPASFAGHHGHWKFGLKYRTKDKDVRPQSFSFARVGPTELYLSSFLDPKIAIPILDGRYRIGPSTEMVALREHFQGNPALFALNQGNFINDNLPGTYFATEDVASGYVMGTTTIGKLRLVGGARYEHTRNEYTANVLSFSPTGAFLGAARTTATSDYGEIFPAVVGTYRFTDRMMLRGAVTRSIARPDYGDLNPRRSINDDSDRISEGNPALKPLLATNFDLSFELYLQSAGSFTVGAFYKDIENFSFTSNSLISGGTYNGWRLTRPENGPSGRIQGLELGWSQAFKFLPKPFDGLGIQANHTLLDGRAQVPGRGTMDRLPDQVERVSNVQLYYEKFPFSARLAFNFNGSYIRTVGVDALNDEWFDDIRTVDASLSYTLRKGWNLYLEGKNLTDEVTRRIYFGRSDRPNEHEYPGWSMVGGVKFEF
ncbi:MAG: TonB-dependent receptor [Opitutaceae bacterium]|nr:TonB-dependent receptor [Opitutaceae bacterium]